ncbi:MAG: transcriptional repressor [Anaerolineales bacterium]|nr:transcriptional repressor [Anaerolineales bacterium]
MTRADILERLRASGYRLTRPRRALVEALLQAERPLTADELHRRVRRAGMNLSTVYRNLSAFVEMGWLTAMCGVNGKQHYCVQAGDGPSFSILCLDCGKINPVAAAPDPALSDTVRGLGFKAESLRVTLAAHCAHVCKGRSETR